MDQSYLSLGDMVTFLGLIVAAFQLIKPRYALIWKLSSNILKTIAVALLVIGYLSPLASIVIPDASNIWNGLTLHQYLQVVGFVLITIGSLIVAYLFSRYNRRHLTTSFTRLRIHLYRYPKKKWRNINIQIERNKQISTRSAKKFYRITSLYLIRGHIEEVVEVIRPNLMPLVHSARRYTPDRYRTKSDESKERPKPNGANFAFETLYQLLTDQAVMKHICTNDRFFLRAIVENEIDDGNGGMNNEFASVLYPNLIEHLVLNSDSFLYTQMNANYGSARFANVYDLLTDEKIIMRQHIVPSMLTYHVSKEGIPLDKYAEVVIELLERLIKSYKKHPGSSELLSNIRQLFDQLIGDDGITRRLAYDQKERRTYSEDFSASVASKVFTKLHTALSTGALLFSHDDPEVFKTNNEELKAQNEQGTYDHTTFTGLMAHKVYELIEDLFIFYRDTDDPDGNLLREVFSYVDLHVDTLVADRYQELLWERLFDKAVDGRLEFATNIKGYYPYILRFIINYLTPFNLTHRKSGKIASDRLKNIMANELKDALLADKKTTGDELIKDALLPPSVQVKINKTKKTVEYYRVNNKGKKTLLDLSIGTKAAPRSKSVDKPSATVSIS